MKGGNLNFYLDREFMEEDLINIQKEDLRNMSVEELVDLKLELDDLLREVQDLIEQCDEVL